MTKSFLTVSFAAFLLSSCGGEATTEGGEQEVVVEETACTYSYNADETVLTWTAFKLTERTAVNGTFDQINVTANDGADNMFAVLSGATFEIPVSSLNSQDEIRDPKIKKSFFGVMEATSSIVGSVVSIDKNKGTVEITMNGKTVQYSGDITVDGEEVKLVTEINITDFDGQTAIDSLGIVCEAKHTGTDGINKLWNEVEIAVKTTLTKTCE